MNSDSNNDAEIMGNILCRDPIEQREIDINDVLSPIETRHIFKKFKSLCITVRDLLKIKTAPLAEQKQILAAFCKKYENEPRQKSKQWHANRQTTLGGSEVGILLRASGCFGSYDDLVSGKVSGEKSFNGNRHTIWGNIFEPVTHTFTMDKLKITICHDEMNVPGPINGIRYSPDAIGIWSVKLNNILQHFIVLFEYKSPSSTVVETISDSYMCQVQTGLICTPADIGIFVNNAYRKCSLDDWDFTLKYNKALCNSKEAQKIPSQFTQVYAKGVIGFYQRREDYHSYLFKLRHIPHYKEILVSKGIIYPVKKGRAVEYFINKKSHPYIDKKAIEDLSSNTYDTDILVNTEDAPIDFGKSNDVQLIERLFELFDEKRVVTRYLPIVYGNCDGLPVVRDIAPLHGGSSAAVESKDVLDKLKSDEVRNDKLKSDDLKNDELKNDDLILIGYLPWKLLKSSIILIDKYEGWMDIIDPHVQRFLSDISSFRSTTIVEEQQSAVPSEADLALMQQFMT